MCYIEHMSEPLRMPARRHTLRVDAGPLTEPFLVYCKTKGLKEGAMLRSLIARELGSGVSDPVPAAPPRRRRARVGQVDKSRVRREVRFTKSELALLEEQASKVELTLPEYLVALARAHAGEASASKNERLLLSKSNYQLLAIGRNLNQVARMLNSGQPLGVADFGTIEVTVRKVREHVKVVSSFLSSLRARWVIEDERG